MSREIRFRAWDRQNDQMVVDPAFIQIWGNGGYEVMHDPCGNQQEESYWHDDADIMQFTGLLDKNKVPIYEGDVVKNSAHYEGDIWYNDMIQEVVFECGSFMLQNREKNHWNDVDEGDIEVIGNIHENPELIEKPHHSTEVK